MNIFVAGLILFLMILWIMIYMFDFKTLKFKKFKINKANILVLIIFFISAFSILTVTAKQEDIILKDDSLKELKNDFVSYQSNGNLSNKIIVVGDSRMSLIKSDKDIIKPINMIFVAKSGMQIEWLENDALSMVRGILKDKNYNYHVVVNMGVNDLNTDEPADVIANNYFKLYRSLAKEYPDIELYLLSVNPINEEKIHEWEDTKRTTNKVKLFNNAIQNNLKNTNLENMHYCDSYNDMSFETEDGLHYTQGTNKRIINYIVNDCVQY